MSARLVGSGTATSPRRSESAVRLDYLVPPQHDAAPMDSGQLSFPALLAGTLARWRMAALVAAGTVLVALALAVILPPSFRAIASFVTTDAESGLGGGGLADCAGSA